jgi:hypothetical protein
LGNFTEVITLIVNVTLGIRKLFSNFLLGVNGFVRSVRDRIQSVLFSIRMNFIKLNNLMGRVYGTMFAVIFMGMSAMTAGFNIADNDLIKFLFEFCFDPNTVVTKYGGEQVKIRDLQIGDRLLDFAGNPVVVTSTFQFDGSNTPMVNLHGTTVSAQHYVLYEQSMIPAGEHPDAVVVNSIPELICINVSGNRFIIGEDIFADYDEHCDARITQEAKIMAEKALNAVSIRSNSTTYDLGIDPNAFIKMNDGSNKQIQDVQIGDILANAGKVLGIVSEKCEHTCLLEGIVLSSDSLVWNENKWVRCGKFNAIKTENIKATILRQFITERTGVLEVSKNGKSLFIRDYREVPLPEMEEVYEKYF